MRHQASTIAICALAGAVLFACGNGEPQVSAESAPSDASSSSSPAGSAQPEKDPARIDPRRDGFQVSLGEWAVTPEVKAVRPGHVTMVVTNRGTIDHGFEIEINEDHSGPGGGDGFKFETELLSPGESTRFRLNLPAGVYKIECLVEGHDDLGMEAFLRVTSGARLVAQRDDGPGTSEVSIADFAFSPTAIRVLSGSLVTWTNDDPTEHTVTALDSSFDSGVLGAEEQFSERLQTPGTYRYRCNIHPDMTARVEVLR